MNSKDQAVGRPLGRSLWVRCSSIKFDLNIWILRVKRDKRHTKAKLITHEELPIKIWFRELNLCLIGCLETIILEEAFLLFHTASP